MADNEQKAVSWTLAGLLSVGFHAVLLALFVGVGSSSRSIAPSAKTPDAPAADVRPVEAPAEQSPSSASSAPPPAAAPAPAPASREPSPTPAWVDRVSLETLPAPEPRPSAAPTTPSPTAVSPPAKRPVVYVVRRGDNLTRLAARDGSTLAELAALNGTTVKKLSNLKVGQKIRLKNGVD